MSKSNRTGRAIGGILAAIGLGGRRDGESLGDAIGRVKREAQNGYVTALRQAIARQREHEAANRPRMSEAVQARGGIADNLRRQLAQEREFMLTRDDGILALASAIGRDEAGIIEDAKTLARLDELERSAASVDEKSLGRLYDDANRAVVEGSAKLEAVQRELAAARQRQTAALHRIENFHRANNDANQLRLAHPWLLTPEGPQATRRRTRPAAPAADVPEAALEVVRA